MISLLTFLKNQFGQTLQQLYGESALASEHLIPEITQSAHAQFGHYQCNNCLRLGKAMGKNPRAIAEEVVKAFPAAEFFSKIEIAGPGFINLTFKEEFLSAQVAELVRDPRLGIDLPEKPQRVIVEFSSPNVAKELHVGHLRSTIIGDSLARTFEFLGHDVLRLNHIGDWGTQFGMLITYMESERPDVLNGSAPTDLSQLMHWYRESKKKFDLDADFKKRAQLKVVALQGGDLATIQAWKLICEISRQGFAQIYHLLDIQLTERGESFYNPFLKAIVDDLEKKGLITISEGAKCLFLEGFETREGTPLPLIVQKADGGYNYATTDLAALRHRVDVEKADRIIYVVDAGQTLHFQMVFKAAQKAGYYDPQKTLVTHVPFGVVLGADGKKFKTRSGETEKLIDLIEEAIKEANTIMQERLPDSSQEEVKDLAQVLGVDAVKYADLSCHRLKDYVFSYERMLKFEGNTAAFLLYAYVRIQSIKRKVGKPIDLSGQIILSHPSEIALGLHLRRFAEALQSVEQDLTPNRLAEYLYELAEKFHAFFRDCRVEGSPEEASRLLLSEATGRVFAKGLEILGLKTLDRM